MTNKTEKKFLRLFNGVKEYKGKDFLTDESLMKALNKGQRPHTLFIGCSDSRVIPNLITSSKPGELFIVRNIGNLVPYYDENYNTYVATAAAIEYAVNILHVENIIVCGHSNCGACKALYSRKELSNLPFTKKWLELAFPVKAQVKAKLMAENSRKNKSLYTEQLNVQEQINHLFTYPYIKEKYDEEEISIMGWYYEIKTGQMYQYSPEKNDFEPLT